MEALIAVPIGYCIGSMYIKLRNDSRNATIHNDNRETNSRRSLKKSVCGVILSSNMRDKIIIDIGLRKCNERKLLENQFINDYPDLTLDERKNLSYSITEIKYFDEIEKTEKDYADKLEMVYYKIDEFYNNEIKIKKIKRDYDSSIKREMRFMEKISNVMLNDNIDELNNLYCKEQLDILNDIHKKNTYKSYDENNDDDNYMI